MTTLEVLRLLKSVLEFGVRFIPDGELKTHLSESARRVDDAIADFAENVKFGE